MKLRQTSSEDEPAVNLTPLIDVVFILLIFFMVSTTFQRESEIKIELPEASSEPVEEEKESLEIVIDADGHYFIDEQQVVNTELETLKTAIRKFLGEVTLLGQSFVKDPDLTVGKLLDQSGATVLRFERVELGEGIEKKSENFADEVMAQVKGG